MIECAQGDILKTEAEALVNTFNCVGIIGRGIALHSAKSFQKTSKPTKSPAMPDK
jgi:O-acetyl-ADP-ribose deacetylase (regulator of RNase III)